MDAVKPTMLELLEPSDVKIEPDDITIEHNITTSTSIQPLQYFLRDQQLMTRVKLEDNQVETVPSWNDYHAIKSEPSSSNSEQNIYTFESDGLSNNFAESYFNEYDNESHSSQPEVIARDPLEISCAIDASVGQQPSDEVKGFSVDEKSQCNSPLSPDPISTSQRRICTKLFKDKRRIQLHEKVHISRTPCPKCPRMFASDFALDQHVIWKHSGRRYQCVICEKVLASPGVLKLHMNTHFKVLHPSGKPRRKSFQCCFCSEFFLTKNSLRKHEKTHTERVFCDYCKLDFGYKGSLVRHIFVKHSGITFQCAVCKTNLSSPYSLSIHMKLHTRVACKLCHLSFADETGLNCHNRRSHSRASLNRFKCDSCEEVYTHRHKLKEHVKKLHGDPKDNKIPCPLCKELFDTVATYKAHVIVVHTKYYQCRRCDLSFACHSDLVNHRKTHFEKAILNTMDNSQLSVNVSTRKYYRKLNPRTETDKP